MTRYTMRLHPVIASILIGVCGSSHGAEEFVYTVQVGDHPWNIAQRYLKDASLAFRLTRLNHIANDRTVAPGTEIRIPAQWLKLQAARVRVLTTHGKASIEIAGSARRPAVANEVLTAGSRLLTGAASSAMLEFEDGSRVMVRQGSEVQLVRSERRLLDGGFMVELELIRGGLENMVKPRSQAPTRFEIRTPAAVAAVRGTRFRVHADSGATWTEVLGGAVQVGNVTGGVRADAGFGTIAQAGRTPEAPRPLLSAPDLSDVPTRLERLPIDWPLSPVVGAAGYRTQVAPDARFESILSDEQTTQARARVLDVPDGSYILRVRAIDADGLEGLVGEQPIVVYARPQAPALINPVPDGQTTEVSPVFQWTQADPAWHYKLELRPAGDPSAAALHTQNAGSAQGTTLPAALTPGLYQWRVASIVPATGRQGPWGDLQVFRVVLPGPDVAPVQVDAGNITVRWPVLPNAVGYDMQVATDAGFAHAVRDVRSAVPQQQLSNLAPGAYQLRVRSISADGFAGPWGQVQGFTVPEPEPEPEPPPWRALLIVLPALLLLGL